MGAAVSRVETPRKTRAFSRLLSNRSGAERVESQTDIGYTVSGSRCPARKIRSAIGEGLVAKVSMVGAAQGKKPTPIKALPPARQPTIPAPDKPMV